MRRRPMIVSLLMAAVGCVVGCLHPDGPTVGRAQRKPAAPAETIPTTTPPAKAPAKEIEKTGHAELEAKPVREAAPLEGLAMVRRLVERSREFYEKTPNYSCRVVRQERVGGVLQPRETIMMNFRRQPRSVYYKWIGDVHAGRECVWVEGRNDNKIVSLGGKGDFLLAGRKLAVDPNSSMATSRSRYVITEAGLDKATERLADMLANQERGDTSKATLEYAGLVKREEFASPVHDVIVRIPASADPKFPAGAVRHSFFEAKAGRLAFIQAADAKGELQEYYLFDRLIANDTLTDKDFDPETLWPDRRPGKRATIKDRDAQNLAAEEPAPPPK